jgi:hypothetical protein
MKSLKEQLVAIDNERFKELIEVLEVKDVCFKCHYFNPKQYPDPLDGYRCKCAPYCIAATLHPKLQEYLLKRVILI